MKRNVDKYTFVRNIQTRETHTSFIYAESLEEAKKFHDKNVAFLVEVQPEGTEILSEFIIGPDGAQCK